MVELGLESREFTGDFSKHFRWISPHRSASLEFNLDSLRTCVSSREKALDQSYAHELGVTQLLKKGSKELKNRLQISEVICHI